MNRLDTEEKEVLEAFEAGKLKRSHQRKKELTRHRSIAEATFKKDARINIRLPSKDLRALQAKALREGVPYQTLVASILHKYADGQLVEKSTKS